MLPRLKIILAVSLLLGFINVVAPVLADDVVVTTCTNAGLQTAINTAAQNGGGTVTFNCGTATIPITTTLDVDADTGSKNITIDGGNSITLDGQNTTRLFFQRTWGNNSNTLTLQNLTLTNGRASGSGTAANGGAILSRFEAAQPSLKPILNIDNVTFSANVSNQTGASGYDFGGGAIFSQGGFVTVTNSTFNDNVANNAGGGAIHILQSGLTIADTTFSDNTAGDQGGTIYVDGVGGGSGVFSITGSSFSGSRSRNSGGAIYVNMYEDTNSFTVDRTSFIDNGVDGGTRGEGGAIAGGSTTSEEIPNSGNASITVTNSLFSQNFVDLPGTADGSGGAINFNQKARITIANSTFDGNRAEGNSWGANGGAIFITSNTDQFIISNSTISNNFAGWVGGGIVASPLPSTTTPGGIIRNTIFLNNTADNGPNDWNILQHCGSIDLNTNPDSAIPGLVNGGSNIQFPAKLTTNWNDKDCATGITIANPLLSPLANNGGPTQTRALQSGSPAIDTGSNAICAAAPINNLDQRGQARPVDGDEVGGAQCDVGAFEYVPNPLPFAPDLSTPAINASLTGTFTVFAWQPAPFATSYHLLVDDDADFSSPVVDTTLSGTSYIPSFVGVGTFSWKVDAINSNGNDESDVRTFTLSSTPNAVPTRNFTSATSQTLTWSPLTWAIGYQVEIASDMGFTDIVDTSAVLPVSADSYTATLEPGVYYWRVKGQKSDLTFGAPSAAEMLTVGSE